MARISLSQVNSLPDILPTDGFTMQFGNVPGFNGDSSPLTIKCANVMMPGFSNAHFQAMLHGLVVSFRGRKDYPRQVQIQFVEDRTFSTNNALKSWMEFIVGTNSATSAGNKSSYAIQGLLTVYDQTGAAINNITFYNMFPTDIQDTQLTGEQTAMMLIGASFSYDWHQSDTLAIR